MRKKLLLSLILIISFAACKKENDNPQWDLNVIGPLFTASLGFENLIGENSILSDGNGAQIINFDTTISILKLDSIYTINDTVIPTSVLFPPFATTLPANFPFTTSNNIVRLGIGDLQLKQATVFAGHIKLEIKNTLHTKVFFVYEIPKATLNGHTFKVTASVDSASASGPKFFTGEYDFSGYDIDLTGANGNLFNSLAYNVEARSDPNGTSFDVGPLDTVVNLKTSLLGIEPYFVRGYLGQNSSHESTRRNLGIGGIIKDGLVQLDSVQLSIDIENYIGADAQAYVSSFSSVNHRTGTTVDLVSSSFLNHFININRAYLQPGTNNVEETHYSVTLDNSNSNIREWIENIPDELNYSLDFTINPLGDFSGGNDFVFRDRLVNTHLQFRMPLRFALDELTIADTVPLTIANTTDLDPVGDATLTLIADNGFPFDLNMQLFLMDSAHTFIDSLIVPDLIKSAPVNSFYRVINSERTVIPIQLSEERKKHLQSSSLAGIRAKFNTPDYPELIQMYSGYRLDLKLVVDGTYSIR